MDLFGTRYGTMLNSWRDWNWINHEKYQTGQEAKSVTSWITYLQNMGSAVRINWRCKKWDAWCLCCLSLESIRAIRENGERKGLSKVFKKHECRNSWIGMATRRLIGMTDVMITSITNDKALMKTCSPMYMEPTTENIGWPAEYWYMDWNSEQRRDRRNWRCKGFSLRRHVVRFGERMICKFRDEGLRVL